MPCRRAPQVIQQLTHYRCQNVSCVCILKKWVMWSFLEKRWFFFRKKSDGHACITYAVTCADIASVCPNRQCTCSLVSHRDIAVVGLDTSKERWHRVVGWKLGEFFWHGIAFDHPAAIFLFFKSLDFWHQKQVSPVMVFGHLSIQLWRTPKNFCALCPESSWRQQEQKLSG